MEQNKPKHFLYLIAFSAAIGGFLFGYDTAVISGTISFVENQFILDSSGLGWFVSSALVGCIVGVIMSGELADRFGRRLVLFLSGFLFFLSAMGCAVASSFSLLIIYRIIGGLGVGIASMVAPLYISEISPAKSRGKMVALYQFAITIGILAAYFVNAYLLNLSANLDAAGSTNKYFVLEVWRGMFGSEAIPAFLFIIALIFVPLSPRWLISKNKLDEASKMLRRLGTKQEALKQQVSSIQQTMSQKTASPLNELFHPGVMIAIVAGMLLALFSQLTGINAIIYYGPKILEEAGFKLSDALGGQVMIGIVNALSTLIGIALIDRIGRKKLLSFAIVGMMICLVSVGYLFYVGNTQGPMLLTFIVLYIMSFALGYGPVIWVLLSELYPTRIRGRAMSIATLAVWVGTALIGQLVPWMLEVLTPAGTFFVFAICCVPVLFILKMIPETKGKTLEEIEAYWLRKN